MNRRTFLHLAATSPLLAQEPDLPHYRIVTRFAPAAHPGMPGLYRGKAVRAHSDRAVDVASNRVDAPTVKAMLSAGIRELTGASTDRDAWSHFISHDDIVGIKVNCSGAPEINSNPELVSAIIENLLRLDVPAEHIYIYDRFENQLKIVNFAPHVPAGVKISGAENFRNSILSYDPFTYVEVDFFGEDDTRSNLIRLVSDKFTKIINVPTMKEHRAAGVTGCLKNIAYGDFSNVARSHLKTKTNTYSFIGTLASVEPLRSRTVLNVMDGLRSLWQGGPFLQSPKFLFFPKQIVLGTDPVALDHLLIEMIETKRKAEGAPSLFDRSTSHIKPGPELDPRFNSFIREPGHVEYASKLGLGVFERSQINEKVVNL
ncbi:MAG: DUF362 domain-containing protein [Acidobacteriaceae bacterium]|nr:DUF362 domain-containing protein [Acidobacteriaceae bacterium]